MSARPACDLPLQVDEVVRVERVGLVVGERAVELEVQRHDLDRQRAEHRGHGVAGHAVAGVDDDAQRADAGEVDERAQVGGVVGEHVAARRPVPPPADRPGTPGRRRGADLGEPGVLPDRRGAGPAELDAVVAGGVVARGEHRAGQVERAGGEVQHVGAGQADVDDVEALPGHALGEGRGELGRARRMSWPTTTWRGRRLPAARSAGRRRRRSPGRSRVELLADDAADVVGLDDRGERWAVTEAPYRPRCRPPSARGLRG